MSENSNKRYENFLKCVDAFILSVEEKPTTLAKCFPRANSECPEALQLISEQLWKNFADNLKAHAMALSSELDLEPLMKKLDENPPKSWKFSGNPRQDASAAMEGIVDDELGELGAMVEASEGELREMEAVLEEKRARIHSRLAETEEKVRSLEMISDECARKLKTS